jgi:hypothetical protein
MTSFVVLRLIEAAALALQPSLHLVGDRRDEDFYLRCCRGRETMEVNRACLLVLNIHPVQQQAVEVHIQGERGIVALNNGHWG